MTGDPIRTVFHRLLAQDSWERPYVEVKCQETE